MNIYNKTWKKIKKQNKKIGENDVKSKKKIWVVNIKIIFVPNAYKSLNSIYLM